VTTSHAPATGPTLRVRVRIGSGVPPGSGQTRVDRGHDVTIQAPPGTTVAQVIDAADLAIADWGWAVINLRTGAVADAADPFEQLAPLDGDHLFITDREAAANYRAGRRTVARHTLDVIAGPAGGERLVLRPPAFIVGRDGDRADTAISDPSLSRQHLRFVERSGGWTVEDLDSRNGTAVDGAPLDPGVAARLEDGSIIEAGRSTFRFNLQGAAAAVQREARDDGTIGHIIPARVTPPPFGATLEAPEVPGRPSGPRLPLVLSIVPLIGGVALWQFTGQVTMLLFCLLAPLMALGTWLSDKLGGRADFKKAGRQFLAQLDVLEQRVQQLRAEEHALRLDLFPDPREVSRRMTEVDRRLWERAPQHHDYLHLRIGLTKLPSEVVVDYGRGGGDDALREEAQSRVPVAPVVGGTPLTVDLARRGPLGVAGAPATTDGVLRWLILQLVGLHSPRDVQLVALLGEPMRRWDWLKWLPHVPSAGIGTSGVAAIGTSASAVTSQLAALAALIASRQPDHAGGPVVTTPRVVVVIRDAAIEDRSQADVLLEPAAANVGIHVIWESELRDRLPHRCRTLLDLDRDRATGTYIDTLDGSEITAVSIDATPLAIAEDAAAALAPVRDATQSTRGIASLPASVSFLDLEAARPATEAVVRERWRVHDDGLRFTVGVGEDGPLAFDLVEVGPHALIAGTTGAGKSELLRAALTSMALRYPPSRLTFLLIDYKGGSAFRQLNDLPHTVGVVTDLDEHLAARALTSLRAEIRYREALIAEHDALDITDLARREPSVALPRLVIAIDEFSTLLQEVPSFIDGTIDVMQRGRSLGIHLVFATQTPEGSMPPKIAANTALSIALRTVKPEQSIAIIGSPEAAFIPFEAKGRAWARIASDLVPFQSAYVGGSPEARPEEQVTVSPFTLGSVTAPRGRPQADDPRNTELVAICQSIDAAFAASGAARPRRPWLPALPARIDARAERPAASAGWLGTIDEPARQLTRPLTFDLARDGNLLILGGPRSGRTTALLSLAASLAWDASTAAVQFYGLDCAGRVLGAAGALPHCGGVVAADHAPRAARLLEWLLDELSARRAAFSRTGAADFDDLQARSEHPLPRIVLLVDDYGAFHERYERFELGRLLELMREVVADGPAFGIHAALTADRRYAVPTPIHAVIGLRVVLRMGDRDEYQRLGLPRAVEKLDLPPGRGFDADARELQLGIWADELERPNAAMQRIGDELRARGLEDPAALPTPIRLLPEEIPLSELGTSGHPWHARFALRERDAAPVDLDLSQGHTVVCGPYHSGRSAALAALVEGVRSVTPNLSVHLVTTRRSPLAERDGWTTTLHTTDPADLLGLLSAAQLSAGGGEDHLVVIDDITEITAGSHADALEAAVRSCRDAGCRLLASAESQALIASWGWLREIRKDGRGLLLMPNLEHDGPLLGVQLPWQRSIEFPPGRGFVVAGGRYDLMQVGLA
jgi:S-DNA-T family DNA segregation ATPase FtsK/SpoIIIE